MKRADAALARRAAAAHVSWGGKTEEACAKEIETEEPARVLMLSTRHSPEVIEYPDSGKVLAKDAKDDDIFMSRYGDPVEYWDGEA